MLSYICSTIVDIRRCFKAFMFMYANNSPADISYCGLSVQRKGAQQGCTEGLSIKAEWNGFQHRFNLPLR